MTTLRIVPQSLFGRLVLVLLFGLMVVQLISAAILLRDRGQVLYEVTQGNVVLRVATIVRLLDSLPPPDRLRVLPALNAPTLRIQLSSTAIPSDTQGATARAAAEILHDRLARTLGDAYALRVTVGEPGVAPQFSEMRHRNMMAREPMMSGPWAFMHGLQAAARSFHIQIRLTDGTWLQLERTIPDEMFSWPLQMMLTLGVLLVGVVAVSLLVVRWMTRPLKTLAEAADELGRDIQRPPLPVTGPREVANAARAFNTMQDRLSRFIDDRSRILAAVSHDLKTPITRMRLRSELLDEEQAREKFQRDLDDMEAMVNSTLEFMRGSDAREQHQPIDIMALLESIQEDGAEAGWEIELAGTTTAPYRGRPLALKRCLTNLVENAVRYGERARIDIDDTDTALTLTITDHGPGIPEERLEQVFEPFHRLEESRSRHTGGTGLGLSVARNIARGHGGDVTLRNGSDGGLQAQIILPR